MLHPRGGFGVTPSADTLHPQNSMNLPPDKMKLLNQYDNEKKWELICDQVRSKLTPSPVQSLSPSATRGVVWASIWLYQALTSISLLTQHLINLIKHWCSWGGDRDTVAAVGTVACPRATAGGPVSASLWGS